VSAEAALPILHAEDARIAIDDVVAIDRLTVRARGDRVLCTGEAEALFAALTVVPLRSRSSRPVDDELPGEAHVVSGSLLVAGRDVAASAHLAVSGVAPLDPPLPPRWTAHEYVTWSARLAGLGARASRDLAASAIERVGLSPVLRRPLGALDVPARRALVLAHAIVADPAVIILESPLAGLDGASAGFVTNAIFRASEGRGAILSAQRIDPATAEGEFFPRVATDVLVFAGGALVLEGAPEELFAGVRVYGVTVRKNPGPFRDELLSRGMTVKGGPLRMSVTLSAEGSTKDIVAAASKARAPLVEMFPIIA
jgi:ABC-2 type transport system ATP-binding protein